MTTLAAFVPRAKRGFLSLVILVALALLTGCSPPWVVVRQATPNPLVGRARFGLKPIDFRGVRIGAKSEAEYLAGKKEDSRQSWLGDKEGMNGEFVTELVNEARDEGIQVTPGGAAEFLIEPQVTFVEPGFYAYVARKSSEVHMTLRIVTPDGRVVDEITMRHSTVAQMTNPSSGGRLRDDAEGLGGYTARYLKTRVIPEPSD